MRVENVLTVSDVKSTPYVDREEAKSSPLPLDTKLWMPHEWINPANEGMVGGEWTVLFLPPLLSNIVDWSPSASSRD